MRRIDISLIICVWGLLFFQGTCSKPEIRILVLSQLTGSSSSASAALDSGRILQLWRQHLQERSLRININHNVHIEINSTSFRLMAYPAWPFNATFELVDTKSNATYTELFLRKRLNNSTIPKIHLVTGPESKSFIGNVAKVCSQNHIPLVSFSNSILHYPRLPIYNTSFFVSAQNVYQFIEVVNGYEVEGVKSIVAVAMITGPGNVVVPLNAEACFGSASYAQTKGIQLLANYSLYFTYTRDQIKDVIREIRDVYNPDAIMWCDAYSSSSAAFVPRYQAITMFKELNYLPKALTMINALDSQGVMDLKSQGLFLYVTGGSFVSDKVTGRDFTEGDTPYSSRFRPSKLVNNIIDYLNTGSTVDSPPSTKLFYDWYKSKTNKYPIQQTVTLWATFDIIEAALFRACSIKSNLVDGISAQEVYLALQNMQLTTPGGPIAFDTHGDNMAFNSLFMQALSTTDTADIVYPLASRTASIVYPMPTWDDRVYTWRLIGDGTVRISIAVATACSLLILAIAITVIVYRKEPEVRMLHYLHVVSLCLAALLLVWSLVFLWQRDNSPTQCGAFMWTVFLPASYMVHLVNIKAYRLSLFVVASAPGRRPRPFSHMKVLRITFSLLLVTVVVLGIVQAVSPPVRTKFVTDKYRPRLDEYRCVFGDVGKGLLFFLVVAHFLASMLSVLAVRNGMEDFRDGLVMKEAFAILYMCLLVVFIMGGLQLTPSANYLLRTVILSVGVTLFLFRLLASRVVKYWVPEPVRHKTNYVYDTYLKSVVDSFNVSSSVASGGSKSRDSVGLGTRPEREPPINMTDVYEDCPAYQKEVPKDNNLKEMFAVLKDPRRLRFFKEAAVMAMCKENVDFLCSVLEFEEMFGMNLSQASGHSSDAMRLQAAGIMSAYLSAEAEKEVNVSSGCRSTVEKSLQQWILHSPLLNEKTARDVLETDCVKRYKMFQPAFKEISIMTYQNLWNRFRTAETNYLAMGGDDYVVTDMK